ncbi:hypothetical protein [Streptomyces sp. NPDC054838]
MADSETEPTADVVGEGIQQVPLVIPVKVVPAAAEARDALLQAIGKEAEHLAERSQGQASKALEELARAYALVMCDPTTATAGPAKVNARYASADLSGFTGSVVYGFGEQAGANSNVQAFGAGGTYVNGPLGLYAGYLPKK